MARKVQSQEPPKVQALPVHQEQESTEQRTDMDDYDRIELQQMYPFLAGIYTLRAYVLSGLAVANVTVVGLAVNSRISILFLLGAAIALLAVVLEQVIHNLFYSVLLRGITLACKYGHSNDSLFVLIAASSHRRLVRTLKGCSKTSGGEAQVTSLELNAGTYLQQVPLRTRLIVALSALSVLAQVLAAWLMAQRFGWTFIGP